MNRDKIARNLQKLIGHYNFIRLQSYMKYQLTFRTLYTSNAIQGGVRGKTLVYMADGLTSHGGFSDRLRGIFSLYEYCQKNDIRFKIYFIHPFKLEDFLLPNHYDWQISAKELSYSSKETEFKFINSYSDLTEELQDRFLKTKKANVQLHVYSNWTSHEERFKEYFNTLFKLSPMLDDKINKYLDDIGCKFISVSFRLISLLGDFKDSSFAEELSSSEEKEEYIQKCLAFVERLHQQYPQFQKILVTTDSGLFLKRLEAIPYVYTIKGDVIHMDYVDEHFEGHLKTMIDYFLISKAEKVFCYSYGKMFKSTKFAKTAALIGGKEFEMVSE